MMPSTYGTSSPGMPVFYSSGSDNRNGDFGGMGWLFALLAFGRDGFGRRDGDNGSIAGVGNALSIQTLLSDLNALGLAQANQTTQLLQAGNANTLAELGVITSGFQNTALALCGLDKTVLTSSCATNNLIQSGNAQLSRDIFGTQVVLSSEIQTLRHEVDKGFCQTNFNIERGNNALALQIERGFNAQAQADLLAENQRLRDAALTAGTQLVRIQTPCPCPTPVSGGGQNASIDQTGLINILIGGINQTLGPVLANLGQAVQAISSNVVAMNAKVEAMSAAI